MTDAPPPPTHPFQVHDAPVVYVVYFVLLVALAVATAGFGFLGPLYFGGWAVWAMWRAVTPRPSLFFTEEGVADRTYAWSPGLIRWSDVLDVRPSRWGLIEIELRDEEAFWKQLSWLGRMAAFKWQLLGRSPAVIPSSMLATSRPRLLEALEAGMDAYALRAVSEDRARLPPATGESGEEITRELPD